jgi:hypothetical protein
MPGLIVPFITFTLLYIALSFVLYFLLQRQFIDATKEHEKNPLTEVPHAGHA